LLRLLGREADPTRSREHVVLCQFAERRLRAGQGATLEALLEDLARPPIARIGAMAVDDFLPPRERTALSQQLNTLLASPSFASWRQGAALDVGRWLARPPDGRTPAVIVSVSHLDDDERALVLGLLFDAILAWVRGLSGTSDLRALVVFDEVFGFIPPHPANPPTKKPLMALMKQARAFGVGLLLATQNPMDLDYKALSNAGVWFVGRLQTDADRQRVVEGLAGSDGGTGGLQASELAATLRNLPKRAFFLRNVHRSPQCALVESRWCLSWLRGPMTRAELRKLVPSTVSPVHRATSPSDQSKPIAGTAHHGVSGMPPTVVSMPAVTPPPASSELRSERGSSDDTTTAPPQAPEGWKTWHGHADAAPVTRWKYVPYVAVKVVGHLRDPKVGLDLRKTEVFAAPLLEDGRADITRALVVDPRYFENVPPPGARYAPLPPALSKAPARKSVERMMKDHAARTFVIERWAHRSLGLVQSEQESRESFAQRCREAAARRDAVERADIEAKHAPKIQRLAERAQVARAALAAAEAEARAAPGGLGVMAVGMFVGKGAAKRAATKADKAKDKLQKARLAVANADSAWREAVNVRDQEIAAASRDASRAAEELVRHVVTPKKSDVEVLEIGVAWARG
jgi:hypothetical protein